MSAAKEYVWTPEHCMTMAHGVCHGCGGELEPIETVDNSGAPTFWPGCVKCSTFDYGVSKEAFDIASKLFEEGEIAYSHIERPRHDDDAARLDYYRRAQVRGLSSTVARILRLSRIATLETELAGLRGKVSEDYIESAYWRFDARRKGYGEWEGRPMSERDAFKAEMRQAAGGGDG